MRISIVVVVLALALSVPAAAQRPPATVQQQFDAASAAREAGNWTEALRIFDSLLGRVENPRTRAVVQVRRGTVLVELGRYEHAEAAILSGLPVLPAADASLSLERFQALVTLGRIAEHRLDYPEAQRHYRAATQASVDPAERLVAYSGLAQALMFTDAGSALREIESALALAEAADVDSRQATGQLHTLRGRTLLNLGRHQEARRALEQAQRLLGGTLAARVDRADLVARSDLAIAALLSGRLDDARRYLAYAGTGVLGSGHIFLPPGSDFPPCGGTIGPDDVAVVELSVEETGRVTSARPVYFSRRGPGAIEFARVALGWQFDPEGARGIGPLFRSVVRVQMHCSQDPAEAPTPPDRDLRGVSAVCEPRPRQLSAQSSSDDFPNAALRWGFEGVVLTENLVGRDGIVVRSRTLMAYPPFVFGDTAKQISERNRYAPLDLPDGASCFDSRQSVSFRLARPANRR